QLVESMRIWLGERRAVELFAERDTLPYERLATDPITEQNRLRALIALTSGRAPVVVTTGRALMDCLASPDDFGSRFLELGRGSLSDPNALAEHLVRSGYSPMPLVEDP